tara:strand:- start:18842 stop:19807 length:966 start_codon:yes stop_codon:yes gene_type:complete
MNILITGCAGFIGFHLSVKLLKNKNCKVIGIDNIDNYYDVNLKKKRLKELNKNKKFSFYKINITNNNKVSGLFKKKSIDCVVHLAAQAGVRYSIEDPSKYLDTNIVGFFNIMEQCKENKIRHFLFASTSSVYGDNKNFPLQEHDINNKPLSFYAATKLSNEVMAYSYSNIYRLPITGLRFFTVYGPFGRPDMALYKFAKAIKESKFIKLFNGGNHIRDFTYIDDVVSAIILLIKNPPKKRIPYEIYNIGSSRPETLRNYLSKLENLLGKKAKIKKLKLQKGDVLKTHASISKLKNKTKFKVKFDISSGISKFVDWFNKYYN